MSAYDILIVVGVFGFVAIVCFGYVKPLAERGRWEWRWEQRRLINRVKREECINRFIASLRIDWRKRHEARIKRAQLAICRLEARARHLRTQSNPSYGCGRRTESTGQIRLPIAA